MQVQREDQRRTLIRDFNRLFGPGQVAATAARLGPLLPTMDWLEIVYRLGLLPFVPADRMLRYREVVGLPPVTMHILTAVCQDALRAVPHPMPVVLDIVQGHVETITIAVSHNQISVHLVRTVIDPALIQG